MNLSNILFDFVYSGIQPDETGSAIDAGTSSSSCEEGDPSKRFRCVARREHEKAEKSTNAKCIMSCRDKFSMMSTRQGSPTAVGGTKPNCVISKEMQKCITPGAARRIETQTPKRSANKDPQQYAASENLSEYIEKYCVRAQSMRDIKATFIRKHVVKND